MSTVYGVLHRYCNLYHGTRGGSVHTTLGGTRAVTVRVRTILYQLSHISKATVTWFKVPSKNVKSESGAERLGLVSMHAGEVRGAVLDLSGTLSSL